MTNIRPMTVLRGLSRTSDVFSVGVHLEITSLPGKVQFS